MTVLFGDFWICRRTHLHTRQANQVKGCDGYCEIFFCCFAIFLAVSGKFKRTHVRCRGINCQYAFHSTEINMKFVAALFLIAVCQAAITCQSLMLLLTLLLWMFSYWCWCCFLLSNLLESIPSHCSSPRHLYLSSFARWNFNCCINSPKCPFDWQELHCSS